MRAAIILATLIIAGCESHESTTIVDQCLRAERFERCMSILPAGPLATQYNDWAEVVSECETAAYYQALRPRALVLPACRSGN